MRHGFLEGRIMALETATLVLIAVAVISIVRVAAGAGLYIRLKQPVVKFSNSNRFALIAAMPQRASQ